jgi:hypothetical protein
MAEQGGEWLTGAEDRVRFAPAVKWHGGTWPMQERLVTVATFSTVVAADLAASALRGHGIQCFLEGEDTARAWGTPIPEPVKLNVRESDAAAAREVLKEWGL